MGRFQPVFHSQAPVLGAMEPTLMFSFTASTRICTLGVESVCRPCGCGCGLLPLELELQDEQPEKPHPSAASWGSKPCVTEGRRCFLGSWRRAR